MTLQKLLTFFVFFLSTKTAFAFQLFPAEKRIHPSLKHFKYHLSSTYYNYTVDGQAPVTQIHIDGVKKSLDILAEKAQAAGVQLSFEYAGTFDFDAVGARNRNAKSDEAFHATLYFDFTSNELWGRQSVPSAAADSKQSPTSEGFTSGGVVRMNSDFLNFIHPYANISRIVMHETLHILGLDHSTVSSANMAYTEFWYPTLSSDDILGLKNIYNVGPATSMIVTATLNGAPAKGIEMALVDTTSGVSFVVLTDATGVAKVRHVPVGNYYIAARELTPTGPCFENPTRGFLTTFLAASGVTNSPSQARVVSLVEGTPFETSLDLIAGTKKFDCHFGMATVLSAETCGGTPSLEPNGLESCYLHMTKPGVKYPLLANNDVSVTNHRTQTDVNSSAHDIMTYTPIGTQSGLSFFNVKGVDPEFGNYSRLELNVDANSTSGTQAALCTDGTEYALVSSFVEVQDFGGGVNNLILLPHLGTELQAGITLGRNFSDKLRPGDQQPGVGPRPANVDTIKAPTAESPTSPVGEVEEPKKKKKNIFGCGVVAAESSNAQTSLLLLSPLVVGMLSLRSRRNGRTSS